MIDLLEPAPPPSDAVAAAVGRCRNHPDFTTCPGASTEEIDAAEAALGITFPAHHRALLAATNGLSRLRGQTNYFGVGPDAMVDIVEFNRPNGWLSTLVDGWLPDTPAVWIGVSASHTLIGLDTRPDSDNEAITSTLLIPRDASYRRYVGSRFTRGLQMACDTGVAGDDDAAWKRIIDQVDHVALDEGLIWGMLHYLESREDTRGVRKIQLTTALRLCVDLCSDRQRLPEDAEVFGMLPYVDDNGLARARWMTSEEFPDGPPSQITVDGQVP